MAKNKRVFLFFSISVILFFYQCTRISERINDPEDVEHVKDFVMNYYGKLIDEGPDSIEQYLSNTKMDKEGYLSLLNALLITKGDILKVQTELFKTIRIESKRKVEYSATVESYVTYENGKLYEIIYVEGDSERLEVVGYEW